MKLGLVAGLLLVACAAPETPAARSTAPTKAVEPTAAPPPIANPGISAEPARQPAPTAPELPGIPGIWLGTWEGNSPETSQHAGTFRLVLLDGGVVLIRISGGKIRGALEVDGAFTGSFTMEGHAPVPVTGSLLFDREARAMRGELHTATATSGQSRATFRLEGSYDIYCDAAHDRWGAFLAASWPSTH